MPQPTFAPAVAAPAPPRFTGWHMTGILAAFFGVVFAVNFTMARLASTTFSGEIVANSYDASQVYNRWLDAAAREKALGWQAHVARQADGRLAVTVAGPGTANATLTGEAWHPLGSPTVQAIHFVKQYAHGETSSYLSTQPLAGASPRARWNLRLTLMAGGQQWHSQQAL